jgi:hypothetical protein
VRSGEKNYGHDINGLSLRAKRGHSLFIPGNKVNRILKKGFHIFNSMNAGKSFGLTPGNYLASCGKKA